MYTLTDIYNIRILIFIFINYIQLYKLICFLIKIIYHKIK